MRAGVDKDAVARCNDCQEQLDLLATSGWTQNLDNGMMNSQFVCGGFLEPVAVQPVGLGSNFSMERLCTSLRTALAQRETTEARIPKTEAALAADPLLVQAAGCQSYPIRKSNDPIRSGIKRVRAWFTETCVYRVLSCLLYTSPSPRD